MMAEVSGVGSQRTIEEIIEQQAKKAKETRNTGELGKDDFLKLLITQVQNQDPMNPTTDTDFIAQMAQFSSLEQMQNLNKTFSYSMGFSMMGKYISAEVADEKTGETRYVSGKVEMVRVVDGEVCAVVGETDIPLGKISQVSDESIGTGGSVTDFSSIIGMLGKTTISNADGRSSSIEGIITSITKELDGLYANLDEVDVKPYNLDIGAFENEEEYVQGMTGKEVTIRFKDEKTGVEFKVTGVLRAGYKGTDEKLRLVLDGIKVPAGNIFSAERIDLLSTEQMLLNAILKELQKLNNPGTEEPEEPEEPGEPEEPVDPGTTDGT